jgi:hypothetical protein
VRGAERNLRPYRDRLKPAIDLDVNSQTESLPILEQRELNQQATLVSVAEGPALAFAYRSISDNREILPIDRRAIRGPSPDNVRPDGAAGCCAEIQALCCRSLGVRSSGSLPSQPAMATRARTKRFSVSDRHRVARFSILTFAWFCGNNQGGTHR